MKHRILLAFAFTVVAGVGWSMWVNACDHDKQTTAQSSVSAVPAVAATAAPGAANCTAAMAAKCTPEMAAKCRAKGASATVASTVGCAGHSATAATASAECSAHAMKTKSTAANGCAGHGAKGAMASECKAHGAAASALAACLGHGMLTTASMEMHGEDCDACGDMVGCARVLNANGAQIQTLPLKNGVMFVYTTDTPARVRAVQEAMTRRSQRVLAMEASGARAKLCPACKEVRGAVASGKLNRETVNIEGGCLTLVTSSDPSMVAKLRGLAGPQGGARAAKI